MDLKIQLGKEKVNWASVDEMSGSLELTNECTSSFNQFLKISSNEDFNLLSEKYQNVASHFTSSSYAAPLLIPRAELKNNLAHAENKIKTCLEDEKNKEYLSNWIKIDDFLKSLKRVRIDESEVIKLISEKQHLNSKSFRSFLPDEKGFAKKVTYNTSSTVTGRLTVASGPQILSTDHSIKSCFRSSYNEGKIYSVDFRSIEPRICSIVTNKHTQEDVYQDLLDEFENLTREQAKLITLTALYGGSENKIAETIGDIKLAKKAISFVRYNFGIDELETTLEKEASSGIIRNVLGRPLREATKNKRVRINHFLQSSAAEVSILLFSDLCKKFSYGVRPLFVIVDALIVDVSDDVSQKFKEECSKIMWKNTSMPTKIDQM